MLPFQSEPIEVFSAKLFVKVNLHWGVARSSRARFFVCFIAPRSRRGFTIRL